MKGGKLTRESTYNSIVYGQNHDDTAGVQTLQRELFSRKIQDHVVEPSFRRTFNAKPWFSRKTTVVHLYKLN